MRKTTGKTASEQLFETYLKERKLDFQYEPDIEGTTKHPDYRVVVGDSEVFFEVTEFEAPKSPPNRIGTLDLYGPIRAKIAEKQKQLRNFKGRMIAIVLCNPSGARVVLEPHPIIGAMLGNIGWTMPYDGETGACDTSRMTSFFGPGGKMIHYKNGKPFEPQNTTISAICVLGMVNESARRLEIRIAQKKRETGQDLSIECLLRMANEAQGTEADDSLHRLCIQVYENPYAVAPLAEAFGTGPWDERFGFPNDCLRRVFVGDSLAALEADELAAGINRNEPFDLDLGTTE